MGATPAIPATLVPGDGIGPEITDAVVSILDALGSPFGWDLQDGGNTALAKVGGPLPPPLLDSIRCTRRQHACSEYAAAIVRRLQ